MSRRTLGRGLAALIPESVMDARPTGPAPPSVHSVPLSEVTPNPEQPRTAFNAQALQELSDSILEHGVLNPIVVRPQPGGGYVLIAGERRLRAAGLAGLQEIPVVVRTDAETAEVQLELALVENLQREDLDAVESARGYRRLQLDYGYTQEEIARKVGKERATVANALRLLKLPDKVLALVRSGELSQGHAKALLGLDDEGALPAIVAQILTRDLSVRATEALVRGQKTSRPAPRRDRDTDRALRTVSDVLTRSLGTAVKIKPKARGDGGKIVIDYYSGEELERLIHALRGD